MKVRLNIVLNAPEDYSCGDCKKCPIHQESYFSTHQYEEVKISCPLGYNSVSCPLEPQVKLDTPQPKIGHWIIVDDCERFIAKCSECGRIEDSRMISKYPYCHCGAKMVESE